jgi:superfamily I DNA/RNA helicase
MQENSLDFDDLLLKATKLLKENEVIRKIYQEKWEYVHIDEYQDTNEVQYLMSRLLSENNNNIAVVGDTDQCLIKGTKIKPEIIKKLNNFNIKAFIISFSEVQNIITTLLLFLSFLIAGSPEEAIL